MYDTFIIQPRAPLTDREIQRNLITALVLREMTENHLDGSEEASRRS